MSLSAQEALSEACGDTTPRDRRNLRWVLWVFVGWAVVFLGVTLVIRKELLPTGPLLWLLATLPAIIAIGGIAAYVRFLRQADELQRVIHLRAMALGFGAVWLVNTCYPPFERLGAPVIDAGLLVVVMGLAYAFGMVLGSRRFR